LIALADRSVTLLHAHRETAKAACGVGLCLTRIYLHWKNKGVVSASVENHESKPLGRFNYLKNAIE